MDGDSQVVLEPSMKKSDSVQTNRKKARAVKLITELGPQITEIASRIGVHKETVRYWYHSLLDKGFTVQASYDFERLGMKRIVMLVDLDDSLKEHAQNLFIAMNNLCYVVSYEKTIPEGVYRVSVSVPKEFVHEYIMFAKSLQQKGIFKSLELFTFDNFRNIPMRAGFYAFETGLWDFDWSSPVPDVFEARTQSKSEKVRFDMLDLLILQELRIDANRSLVEIQGNLMKSRKMDVHYKTLDWHYRTHIVGGRLVKSYNVNWMGTRYNFEKERVMHRKHTYLRVDLVVKEITENEKMHLLASMNGLPFQWSEAVGSNYFTQFAFPTENVTEAFLYFEKVLTPVRDRARYFIMDQSSALSFTIEPSLYNETTKSWKFDRVDLTAKFESMLLQIKSGVG